MARGRDPEFLKALPGKLRRKSGDCRRNEFAEAIAADSRTAEPAMRLTPVILGAAFWVASLPAQVTQGGPADEGSLEGTVINAVTKEPVRKAQVTLVPGNVPPAITDANGHFLFSKLPPSTYTLHAQHPEFPLIVSGLAATSPLMVTLGPQEKKSDLVLSLTPGASISGRVMDEDGRPIPSCNVQTLQFAPGPGGRRLYGTRGDTSDDRGEFRIHGLAREDATTFPCSAASRSRWRTG